MKKKNTFALAYLCTQAPISTDVFVRTPEDAWRVCEAQSGLGAEAFTVMCLNSKNRLIAGGCISLGIVDTCLCHPREVFRQAIMIGASAIVMVHNHPSGDATPSAEDVRITRQLVQASKVIGIKVLDHVIVANKDPNRLRNFCSLREAGVVEFDT